MFVSPIDEAASRPATPGNVCPPPSITSYSTKPRPAHPPAGPAPGAAAPVSPPAVAMSDLDRLAQLEGMQVRRGVAVVSGSVPRYLEVMREFGVNHRDDMAGVRELLAAGNADAARRIAHTLKGVAGMLGAMHLSGRSATLEKAIVAGQDVTALAAEIDTVLAAIDAALREPGA